MRMSMRIGQRPHFGYERALQNDHAALALHAPTPVQVTISPALAALQANLTHQLRHPQGS